MARPLLRLTVGHNLACVPEISANKYALNVRFIAHNMRERPKVAETDVAVSTLVSVRDRVIQSYEDIMKMPI